MTNRILTDRAKRVLKLSNEERIEALIQETVFVHPAFENVHRKLEKLLKHSPSQTTRHLMLIGDTGLGKSTILNTFASCLLYTSPSPRDRTRSRMPSSA